MLCPKWRTLCRILSKALSPARCSLPASHMLHCKMPPALRRTSPKSLVCSPELLPIMADLAPSRPFDCPSFCIPKTVSDPTFWPINTTWWRAGPSQLSLATLCHFTSRYNMADMPSNGIIPASRNYLFLILFPRWHKVETLRPSTYLCRCRVCPKML